jgi:hypothetical protein
MKVIIQATTPTHHTSRALRNLNLKHYKAHGSGRHESWEAFQTMKEAKEYLEDREVDEVQVSILVGFNRLEFIEGKECYNVDWD